MISVLSGWGPIGGGVGLIQLVREEVGWVSSLRRCEMGKALLKSVS